MIARGLFTRRAALLSGFLIYGIDPSAETSKVAGTSNKLPDYLPINKNTL